MTIKGCSQEVKDLVVSAFKNYSISVEEWDELLYYIRISSDIPFILKYNNPTVKIDIGGKIIHFSIEDTVAIELM